MTYIILHHWYYLTICVFFIPAIAQLAQVYNVSFISIRVISNNITNNGVYDLTVTTACQQFVESVCRQYIEVNVPIKK
jgi:adenosylhomocysteine nucleosidase